MTQERFCKGSGFWGSKNTRKKFIKLEKQHVHMTKYDPYKQTLHTPTHLIPRLPRSAKHLTTSSGHSKLYSCIDPTSKVPHTFQRRETICALATLLTLDTKLLHYPLEQVRSHRRDLSVVRHSKSGELRHLLPLLLRSLFLSNQHQP